MPELFRDEETETRTHSLCLFNVSGASSDNRCERCPASAGNWIQQRRCPLGELEHHSPVGAAGEGKSESSDPKFLATSSKSQHVPEVVAISDKIADVSLDEPNRRYARRSRPDAGIRNPSTDMSASVPHVDIGVKRKAYREPESSLRTFNKSANVYTAHNVASHGHIEATHDATSTELGDVVSPRDGSSDIGAEGMQQNKYLNLSQGPVVDGSDSTLADDLNALSIRCDGSPGHTEDGHHSAADMSISVPHVDSGIELKAADYLNQPANASRTELAGVVPLKASADTEVGDLMPKFKDGSKDVEKRLRNKPQHIFQDLPSDEPPFIEGTWDVYAAVPATLRSLLNGFDGCSNSVQEDHPSGRASSLGIRIPGTRMRTEGEGISSCNDGISNRHDPKEFDLLMAQEILEHSIDQIEERRIDGSYFF